MSEKDRFEALKVEGGMPTDCCDYAVADYRCGIEVARVWRECDARLIARLLNQHDGSLAYRARAALNGEGEG